MDEITTEAAKLIGFRLRGLGKSLEESWNRFRRGGLLDSMSDEDKINGFKYYPSISVIYDESGRFYSIITHLIPNEIAKQVIIKYFHLPENRIRFNSDFLDQV